MSHLETEFGLSETTLTLAFSAGVGLHTWRRIGSIERELALYHRMASELRGVNLVSYGGPFDWSPGRSLQPLASLAAVWSPWPIVTERFLWTLHRRALCRSDVIKTNQIPGSDVAVLLARRTGARLIVRCGYLWSLNRSRETSDVNEIARVRLLERRSFEAADVGVVTTEANRAIAIDIHGLEPSKIRVIPNYVDLDHFQHRPVATPGSRPRLLFVGRLAVEKNLGSLIKALSIYQQRTGEAPELVLVGEGPLRTTLAAQAEDLGVCVDFRGSVSHYDLPDLLHQCHVFVLPSNYEGHPKSLLEAMACGVPVLGTDVPGIRDEIEDGETGLLCAPDAESIAHGIDKLLGDEALRSRLGLNGSTVVADRYSLDSVVQLELQLLAELVQ